MLPVKWRHRLGEWLIGERHRTFVVVREEQNSPAPDDESVLSITVTERERYETEPGQFFHTDGENLLAEVSPDEKGPR